MITFKQFLDLCEDYNPNAEFVIFNKKTRTQRLEQQEDLIRQRPRQQASGSNVV